MDETDSEVVFCFVFDADSNFESIDFAIFFRIQGIRGFFRGIEAKLWQTVITSAFMFLFYEKITHLIYYCSERYLQCKIE